MDLLDRIVKDIDELDDKIAQAAGRKPLLRHLQRQRAAMCRSYAEFMIEIGPGANFPDDNPQDSYDNAGREPRPTWLVTGTPSKEGKPLARKWMQKRGIRWDGSAEPLRREVVNALWKSESIPNFGLSIQLTIELKH